MLEKSIGQILSLKTRGRRGEEGGERKEGKGRRGEEGGEREKRERERERERERKSEREKKVASFVVICL